MFLLKCRVETKKKMLRVSGRGRQKGESEGERMTEIFYKHK
jgi:hypothetical protein